MLSNYWKYNLDKWIKLLEMGGFNTKKIVREDMEKELKKLNRRQG